MDINELYIFYFSGTGNAKRVALWLSLNCAKHHLPCHLFNIAKFRKGTLIYYLNSYHRIYFSHPWF